MDLYSPIFFLSLDRVPYATEVSYFLVLYSGTAWTTRTNPVHLPSIAPAIVAKSIFLEVNILYSLREKRSIRTKYTMILRSLEMYNKNLIIKNTNTLW